MDDVGADLRNDVIDDFALEGDRCSAQFIRTSMVGSGTPVEGTVLGEMNPGSWGGAIHGSIVIPFPVPENVSVIWDSKMYIETILNEFLKQSGGDVREASGLHAESFGARAHERGNPRDFRCDVEYPGFRRQVFWVLQERNYRDYR
tara:strand:- start:4287 stop:4724 length:438 start_codon:yes stop_codon:yes gene_type:complete